MGGQKDELQLPGAGVGKPGEDGRVPLRDDVRAEVIAAIG